MTRKARWRMPSNSYWVFSAVFAFVLVSFKRVRRYVSYSGFTGVSCLEDCRPTCLTEEDVGGWLYECFGVTFRFECTRIASDNLEALPGSSCSVRERGPASTPTCLTNGGFGAGLPRTKQFASCPLNVS